MSSVRAVAMLRRDLTRDRVVVGIDPGLSGAVAVIHKGEARVWATPLTHAGKGGEVDGVALLHSLVGLEEGEPGLVVVEKVGGQPGWGSTQSFVFGQSYGAVRTVVALGGWAMTDVRPQAWKKAVLGNLGKWSKQMAIDFVKTRYPNTRLTPPGKRSPSHDWAEAVCLAHYGVTQCK